MDEMYRQEVLKMYKMMEKENDFSNLVSTILMTGIRPSEKTIRRGYKYYLEKWLNNLREREQTKTGISSSEQILWKLLLGYAEKKWVDNIIELQKITGIEPPKEIILSYVGNMGRIVNTPTSAPSISSSF
ncbi:MAG: hypothetical protein KKA64_02750 [Nanoarchaeota archaeon]|nr:hypothetical protein [Nanoarchaeota archaeon]